MICKKFRPSVFLAVSAVFILFCLNSVASAFELPAQTQQAIVGLSSGWNSSKVTLTLYEKRGNIWHRVGGPIPGRLGKSGLAWGLGIHPVPAEAQLKKEGDNRAPAGVFLIGGAWGYAADIQRNPRLPYHQITARDLWVEDVNSPSYNRHLTLSHEPQTAWEKKQQMRQNDEAHSLKVFIAHNAAPQTKPGYGSAIFFHIWRGGGSKPTAGCTTLAKNSLKTIAAWLDPAKSPAYILLPAKEYNRLRAPWRLP